MYQVNQLLILKLCTTPRKFICSSWKLQNLLYFNMPHALQTLHDNIPCSFYKWRSLAFKRGIIFSFNITVCFCYIFISVGVKNYFFSSPTPKFNPERSTFQVKSEWIQNRSSTGKDTENLSFFDHIKNVPYNSGWKGNDSFKKMIYICNSCSLFLNLLKLMGIYIHIFFKPN